MASRSTSYQPVLATTTYMTSDDAATKTYSLSPQTTAFTPPGDVGNACTSSILCPFGADEVTRGAACQAFDWVEKTSARGVRSECYPEGYSDIFYPRSTEYDDMLNMAFPGTACPSGWSTACTQTLSVQQSRYEQKWCCPRGYECDAGGELRNCRSVLGTRTQVWVKNTPTAELFDSITLSQTVNVFRLVFPLEANGNPATGGAAGSAASKGSAGESDAITGLPSSSSGGTGTMGSGRTASNGISTGASAATVTGAIGAGAGASSQNGSSGVSGGQIAGIAVGCTVFLLLLALSAFLYIRKRKRTKSEAASGIPAASAMVSPYAQTRYRPTVNSEKPNGELEDTSVRQELGAYLPEPAEMWAP